MSKYGYSSRTTRESQANLYKAQNTSVVTALVVLIAIAAIITAVVIIFAL